MNQQTLTPICRIGLLLDRNRRSRSSHGKVNKKGQGRCEAALPREKKMPSMSETDGMENMLGTTQKGFA
jgi:hypothetical protein